MYSDSNVPSVFLTHRRTYLPHAAAMVTMFIEVDDLKAVLANVESQKAEISMPVKDQFYGMREFAFKDPDGYTITIAEKIK